LNGDYVAELVVNDGTIDSEPDTVKISVGCPTGISTQEFSFLPRAYAEGHDCNLAPQARILVENPNSQIVNNNVIFDGNSSFDPDGDDSKLNFEWQLSDKPEGSKTKLVKNDRRQVSIKPDLGGIYEVRLLVHDEKDKPSIIASENIIVHDRCTIFAGLTAVRYFGDDIGNDWYFQWGFVGGDRVSILTTLEPGKTLNFDPAEGGYITVELDKRSNVNFKTYEFAEERGDLFTEEDDNAGTFVKSCEGSWSRISNLSFKEIPSVKTVGYIDMYITYEFHLGVVGPAVPDPVE